MKKILLTILFCLLGMVSVYAQSIPGVGSNLSTNEQSTLITDCSGNPSNAGQPFLQAYYVGQLIYANAKFGVSSPNDVKFKVLNDSKVYRYKKQNLSTSSTSSNSLVGAFPYLSNGYPSLNAINLVDDPDHFNNGEIWLTHLQGTTYAIANDVNRDQVASQLVIQGHYQQVNKTSQFNLYDFSVRPLTVGFFGNPLSYRFSTTPAIDQNGQTISSKKLNTCWNYYIAKCGDNVVDGTHATTPNGRDGILVNGTLLPWTKGSPGAVEQCDEGTYNGMNSHQVPGHSGKYCTSSCTLADMQKPTCDLQIKKNNSSVSNVMVSDSVTIVCDGAGGATAGRWWQNQNSVPGYTAPLPITSNQVYDTAGTYTINCQTKNTNNGLESDVCTQTLSVSSYPTPTCNLTIDEQPASDSPFDVFQGNSLSLYCNGQHAAVGRMASYQGQNNTNPINAENWNPIPIEQEESYTELGYHTVVCQVANPDANMQSQLCTGIVFVSSAPVFTPYLSIDKQHLTGSSASYVDANLVYSSGDTVKYKITVKNTGDGTGYNVVIKDVLPAGVTFQSTGWNNPNAVSLPYVNYTISNRTIETTTFPLGPNKQVELIITVKIDSPVSSSMTYVNTGQILSGTSVVEQDTVRGDLTLAQNSNLTIEKWHTVSPSSIYTPSLLTYSSNDKVLYKITVKNTGNGTANNVVIKDVLPAGIVPYSTSISSYRWIPTDFDCYVSYDQPSRTFESCSFSLSSNQTVSLYIMTRLFPSPTSSMVYINTGELFSGNTKVGESVVKGRITISPLDLRLSKVVTNDLGNGFLSGDLVGFKIAIYNASDVTGNNQTLYDYWPKSELSLVGTPTTAGFLTPGPSVSAASVTDSSLIQLITISSINIAPRSTGYIYMTGKMLGHTCSQLNTVVLGSLTDSALYNCGPVPFVMKEQRVNSAVAWMTGQVTVKIGDTISYRLGFQNQGATGTNNVRILDHIPVGITGVTASLRVWSGGSLVMPSPLNGGVRRVGDHYVVEYTGFSLTGQQGGFVYITGTIVNSFAYSRYENTPTLIFTYPTTPYTGNTVIAVRDVVSQVTIDKKIMSKTPPYNDLSANGAVPAFFSGDSVWFNISVTNNGDPVSNLKLTDIWPDPSQNCVKYTNWTDRGQNKWTKVDNQFVWNYNQTLASNATATIDLFGTIVGGSGCAGNYLNTGIVQYVVNGQTITVQDVVDFVIRYNNILLTKTVSTGSLVPGGIVTYVLHFANLGNTPIKDLVITDLWPATLQLLPGINYPAPYTYHGPLPNPTYSAPLTTGGWELTWTWPNNFVLQPGMSGDIILTGRVLTVQEAIDSYKITHAGFVSSYFATPSAPVVVTPPSSQVQSNAIYEMRRVRFLNSSDLQKTSTTVSTNLSR